MNTREITLNIESNDLNTLQNFFSENTNLKINFEYPDSKISLLKDFFLNRKWKFKINKDENFSFDENSNLDSSVVESQKELTIKIPSKDIKDIDPIKLSYLRNRDKLLDLFQNNKVNKPKISFLDLVTLRIEGEEAQISKCNTIITKIINKLTYKIYEKNFKNENEIFDFLEQKWLRDLIEEFDLNFSIFRKEEILNLPEKYKKMFINQDLAIVWFMDTNTNDEFEKVLKLIKNREIQEISLLKLMNKNYDHNISSKEIYILNKIKANYIKKYLFIDIEKLGVEKNIKLMEIIANKEKINIKIECDPNNITLFLSEINEKILKLLRSRCIYGEKTCTVELYTDYITNKLENLVTKFNLNKTYPLFLTHKLNQYKKISIRFTIFSKEITIMEEISNKIEYIINSQIEIVHIDDYPNCLSLFSDFKTIENKYDLLIKQEIKKIILIGNYNKIKIFKDFLKDYDKNMEENKIKLEFDNLLNFDIFKKYYLESYLDEKIVSSSNNRETKQIQIICFQKHIDEKLREFNEIKKKIKNQIITRKYNLQTIDKYQIILDHNFITNLLDPEVVPVDFITGQIQSKSELIQKNLQINEKLSISIHEDGINEDIYIDGLIINFDVKGNHLDKFSKNISEISKSNSILSKEINKLNDYNLNKKKRAEVTGIIEYRNPYPELKITKLFYSIIKNRLLEKNNSSYKQENYKYSIDLKTKQNLSTNEIKFDYKQNLNKIMETVIDIKLKKIGIIVPYYEKETLIVFIKELINDNRLILTQLTDILIFTNEKEETIYFKNSLNKILNEPINKNIENEKENILTDEWEYTNEKGMKFVFTNLENKIINESKLKGLNEVLLVKKRNEDLCFNEIEVNLNQNFAYNKIENKKIDLENLLLSDHLFSNIYKSYKDLNIPIFKYYPDNSYSSLIYLDNNIFIEDKELPQLKYKLSKIETIRQEIFSESPELYGFILKGFDNDINKAATLIFSQLESQKIEKSLILPENLPMDRIKVYLADIEKNHELKIEIIDDKIKIFGYETLVLKASLEIQQLINNELLNKKDKIYPNNWEEQKENCRLYTLNPDEPEYKKVVNNIQKTIVSKKDIPFLKIIKIERIQNKKLYDLYYIKKKLLNDRNNGVINETDLFHGTSTVKPSEIYESQDVSFDFRLANVRMWGTGLYFAKSLDYSNSYCYDNGFKQNQLILANVLLGESIALEADQNLKRPPKKDNDNKLYDSIVGTTQNHKIYIIYENDRAYPDYLITYVYNKI